MVFPFDLIRKKYLGLTSVPAEYQHHRYLSYGESHRFQDVLKAMATPDSVSLVSQGIETAGSAVYVYKRLMHLAFQKPETILQEVRRHWSHVETKANSEVQDTARMASVLLQANEPELAAQLGSTSLTGDTGIH